MYSRTQAVDANPSGDTIKQAVLDLDTDLDVAFTSINAHEAAADPHTGYRLESADHTHATTGAQGGQLDHGSSMVAASLLDDDHTQYLLESTYDAYSILAADTDNTPAAVTLAASQLIGRKATGGIVALAKADLQTIINVEDGANAYVHPNHSGEVTSVAGGALTITNNAVTLAKMATQAAQTILANATLGAAVPTAVTVAEQTVVGRLTGGNVDDISIGIADDNIVQIDHASVADNDYAKFTAAGLEGRSYAEVLSDIGAAPTASPTFTGTVIFPKTIEIQDTSADHQYVLAVSELTADRIVTLPLLTGTDEFVFKDHTQTLTNKRTTARITTITSHATPTINTDNCDCVTITAQAEAITSMTTNLSGTPTNFQKLIIRIIDNGTAMAITWGTSFQSGSATLPTTTVLSKTLMVGLIYDSVDSKWTCEATGSRT